jgi:alpha-1,2-mannosyltransferase
MADQADRTWLTAKRLRAHGLILAVTLWSIYMWTLATPGLRDRNNNLKGTDFLHFYTLGSLAIEHRGTDLYDMNAQAALAAQRVPGAAGIYYLPLYPPQVSIFVAPLAYLSYGWALAVWWIGSAGIYGVCCYGVWRTCQNLHGYGTTAFILAVAFPAFFHLIAWGQTSAAALACFTLTFFLLRNRRNFLAGLALGGLAFKPQLGLAAVVIFLAIGAWKILAGAALSAAAQFLIGILYYGVEPFRRWISLMLHVSTAWPLLEPKPYQTHSLRTFWSMLLPTTPPWSSEISFGLYLLSAGVVLGFTVACWRNRAASLPLKYSALLFASVLLSPHLTVYDLVILAPAFLLLADWLVVQPLTTSTRWLGTLLYFSYMLPLIGPLARWTHLQLSVMAMAGALYFISRICSQTQPNAEAAIIRADTARIVSI